MIPPNSLARQKEGFQGEEEAGYQRKGDQTGTPTYCADAFTGLFRSGVVYAMNRKRHCGGMVFHFTGKAEGARDKSYHLTIGMEGATVG